MLVAFKDFDIAFPWFFTGTFFVVGAIVGSFLNVCIFRIPKGESVVFPGSHCACGKAIPFYLNVPVISWILLRGKAACCGRRIRFRYPAVELLTALVFAAAWHFSPSWEIAVPAMIFSAFAIVLAFIDWDTMTVPDGVSAPFVIAGVVCGAAFPQAMGASDALSGLIHSVVGLGAGSMLLYWFRYFASLLMRREAMGEGDVILLGGIGAFCGWGGAVFSFFASSFLGLFAVVLCKIFSGKSSAARSREASRLAFEDTDAGEEFSGSTAFPLGPWLLLAAVIYLAFHAQILAFVSVMLHAE